MSTHAVLLDGEHLTVAEVVLVARDGAHVALAASALSAIVEGERAFAAHAGAGRAIYGWTTGVGALDNERLDAADVRTFQRNLLRSHAAGVGAPMSEERVRAMLLTRANVLAKGRSGIRLEVVRALLAMLEHRVVPFVPEIGSVGASDLAALAHAALPLIGEGWTRSSSGERRSARDAMHAAGLPLVELEGRDAFALVNGTSQTLGTGALAAADASRLLRAAEVATAMTMVGVESRTDFLDERLLGEGQRPAAVTLAGRRLRELVPSSGSAMREPLSTRCAPQVFGAARASVGHVEGVLSEELNASIDNPSLLPDGELSNNAGTMDAQMLAEALDALATSMTTVAVMSERRTARLLDGRANGGLPAFLVHPRAKAGLCSGLMIVQYTAAALIAELRMQGGPASTQSIPVSNGTEDHGSMSALAARRAGDVVALAEVVVAIEILTATQAVDLRAPSSLARMSLPLARAYREVRTRVPTLVDDRLLADDIDAIVRLLREGAFDV